MSGIFCGAFRVLDMGPPAPLRVLGARRGVGHARHLEEHVGLPVEERRRSFGRGCCHDAPHAPARHGRSASRESRIDSGCQTAMRPANARVMWNARGGGQRAMLYSSPGHPYQAPLRRLSVTRQVGEYTPAPTGSHRTGRTGDSSEASSLDGHHARRVSTLRDCVPVRAVTSSRKPGHELPKSVSRQS